MQRSNFFKSLALAGITALFWPISKLIPPGDSTIIGIYSNGDMVYQCIWNRVLKQKEIDEIYASYHIDNTAMIMSVDFSNGLYQRTYENNLQLVSS